MTEHVMQEQAVVEATVGTTETQTGQPLPALLAYLHSRQQEDEEYQVLQRLLELCSDTLDYANRSWQTGEIEHDESLAALLEVVQHGFYQLLPFLFSQLEGGWRELFLYLPREQRRAWYNRLTERETLPLLRKTLALEDALELVGNS